MSGPDVSGVEEYAEKAAREAVALRVEWRTLALADELCADHRADPSVGLDHCQECYDLACTVSDSSWLAASLEAARVEERERIADELRQAAYDRHRGPHDTEESTLLIVARNLDGGFPVGGSNTSQAVARVLRAVAARIARGEAT